MANGGCAPRVAENVCAAGGSAAPAYTPSAGFRLEAPANEGATTEGITTEAATRASTATTARSLAAPAAAIQQGAARVACRVFAMASSFRLGRHPGVERSAA